MRFKILTVDDSKTVRTIVRKAFKSYDCDVLEASNGAEGLAMVGKEHPDLILLDVTMPVMDGVTLLTKLKSNPISKNIPVIMLTAEGGRENVLRIAKIGVRDYMVKPFREELLVSKVCRVLDLRLLPGASPRVRSLLDPASLLVVEDKPAIIQQIQDGLRQTAWEITGVKSAAEVLEYCNDRQPDLFMISLSLPDDAFTLYERLRRDSRFAQTPIFALCVKSDTEIQLHAQEVGFNAIITKPLEINELESRVARAMNLDTSQRYFSMDAEFLHIRIPEICNQIIFNELTTYLKPRTTEAVDGGLTRAIIDMHECKRLDMMLFKSISQIMYACRDSGLQYALVGNPQLTQECRGFEDTKNWQFVESLEEAKASLVKGAASSSSVSVAT